VIGSSPHLAFDWLDATTAEMYARFLRALRAAEIPFLLGGAYAFARYTGIDRHTKDIDVFIMHADLDRALEALEATGCAVERTHPHWLAKAYLGEDFVDVIYGSGNGVARVDEAWFAHALTDRVLGVSVQLVPPEEMIWQKSFVMERERFDGADVIHLLRARAESLDWPRLLRRFGEHWRILLTHLVLFGFVYPSETSRLPDGIMRELIGKLEQEQAAPLDLPRLCRGTLLSRQQYLPDIEQWGYMDARLWPDSTMSSGEIADWTSAIDQDTD